MSRKQASLSFMIYLDSLSSRRGTTPPQTRTAFPSHADFPLAHHLSPQPPPFTSVNFDRSPSIFSISLLWLSFFFLMHGRTAHVAFSLS